MLRTHRTTRRPAGAATALAGVGLLLAAATSAGAQAPATDSRWTPWLGCWEPAASAPGALPPVLPVTCVVPAGPSGVELIAVDGGRVTSRERIQVTGERRQRREDDCAVWEHADWSADGRRVYLRAEHECGAGVQHVTSGVLALTGTGDWVDVRGLRAGGNSGVRVIRRRAVSPPAALRAEVAAALPTATRGAEAARLAAAAPIGTEAVVEAARRVDAPVIEAWLTETRQGFSLDAKRLLALADAGVPERVIDVMVALSYPKMFAVDPATGEGGRRPADRDALAYGSGRTVGPVWMDRYGYGAFGWNGLGALGWTPWGYSAYNNGWGGWGPGGWVGGGRPVIIVPRPSTGGTDRSTGRIRAVPGGGYTQDGASGDRTAQPRSSGDGGFSGGSSSSRSGGSSAGSSSSSGGGQRTAKPRP